MVWVSPGEKETLGDRTVGVHMQMGEKVYLPLIWIYIYIGLVMLKLNCNVHFCAYHPDIANIPQQALGEWRFLHQRIVTLMWIRWVGPRMETHHFAVGPHSTRRFCSCSCDCVISPEFTENHMLGSSSQQSRERVFFCLFFFLNFYGSLPPFYTRSDRAEPGLVATCQWRYANKLATSLDSFQQ